MKPVFRILLGVLAGAALAFGGLALYGRITESGPEAPPPLPEGRSAVLTHVAGPVFIIRGDQTVAAQPGERLQPGDVVKVTQGAVAQVQLADKGSALLGSDTLVRFLKLTGADQNLELRTEILTGSLSYRVEELDESESIIIEADGTEYEVRGTEFLVEKRGESTMLAVGEGRVAVRGAVEGGRASAGPGEQLIVRRDGPPGRVEPLTEENRRRLEEAAPLPAMPFGYEGAPEPVQVEIRTEPGDAVIYIDGLRTGVGRFRSLLPRNTRIEVRVRRRGFRDRSFPVTADSDQFIEVALEPSDIEETLDESQEETGLLDRIRAGYERQIEELRRRLGNRDAAGAAAAAEAEAAERELERLRAENAARLEEEQARLEIEKARADVLETELNDSRAEAERLKDLIRQIQEIAEE